MIEFPFRSKDVSQYKPPCETHYDHPLLPSIPSITASTTMSGYGNDDYNNDRGGRDRDTNDSYGSGGRDRSDNSGSNRDGGNNYGSSAPTLMIDPRGTGF